MTNTRHEPDAVTQLEPDAEALLDRICAKGGVMTFRIKPENAEVFRLLGVLKAEGLIEEIEATGLFAFRYRVVTGKQSK